MRGVIDDLAGRKQSTGTTLTCIGSSSGLAESSHGPCELARSCNRRLRGSGYGRQREPDRQQCQCTDQSFHYRRGPFLSLISYHPRQQSPMDGCRGLALLLTSHLLLDREG